METLFEVKNLLKRILPHFLLNWYHFSLAFLAVLVYGFPSYQKKMKVIGVTGTNGKSTVVKMISEILEEAGFLVAYSSSIKFKIGKKEKENALRMTMPGRFSAQKFLKEALDNDCQYAILEVTSEGIKQYRHKFIKFDVAVFTNLSPEHIEAHGSFEKYKEAKGDLFKATKGIHILNLDDENVDYFLRFPAERKYGFRIENQESLLRQDYGGQARIKNNITEIIEAKNIKLGENYSSFMIRDSLFNIHLPGEFNISNALTAISVALSQDINLETCKRALEKIRGIPGRMEIVISEPFKVVVDYAFTPNALEKVYQTIKESRINPSTDSGLILSGSRSIKNKESRMICVLGATGGGRDKWKRPVLGKIASKYCDSVIVTNEDPYNEDPMEIINQVAEGVGTKAEKILERKEAIRQSLKYAEPGDVVIITGKGSEPCICLARGKKIPWDDREVVREEFNKLKAKS